jgi:hypothetical protein
MTKKLHRSFIERDTKLKDRLKDLRAIVETINKLPDMALRGGVFKQLAKTDIFTAHIDGILVGYKLDDLGIFMRRRIYLEFPGYKLPEIPENQKDPVMAAIFDVFLDYGMQIPEIDIQREGEVVMIQQHFLPLMLVKDPLLKKGEGNVDDGSGLKSLN